MPGPPAVKQRPRKGPNGWYTPKSTVDGENAVARCAMAAGVRLEPDQPYSLSITFSLSNHRKDIDNATKLVMDGLQRLDHAWNDRQVMSLDVRKVLVKDAREEKTVVTIERRGVPE